VVVFAGHTGGDRVRAGHVQLRPVHLADKSEDHTRPDALLSQPGRPHWLQSVRVAQLQAGFTERRSQGAPARLTSRSLSAVSSVSQSSSCYCLSSDSSNCAERLAVDAFCLSVS